MICFPLVPPPTGLSMATSIVSGVVAVIAACGNSLIITAVIWNPFNTLSEPFNYFLINLTISDLILGAFTMPLSCYYHYKESNGQSNHTLLELLHYSFFISSLACLLSFLALCIDRYIAIARAISYRQYLCWSRCLIVSILIWLISFTLPFLHLKLSYIDYLMVFGNIVISTGLLMLSVVYIRVYIFLKAQTSWMKRLVDFPSLVSENLHFLRLERDRKITHVFLLMLFIFVATYIPALLMIYVLAFCHVCDCTTTNVLRDAIILCINFNCCINPFLCTLRIKKFRQAVRTIIDKFLVIFRKPVKSLNRIDNISTSIN